MDEPQGSGDHGIIHNSGTRRKATATKRAAAASTTVSTQAVGTAAPPCGACKFLRRKCISGCIFAPHFGSDQGAARFAAVHKVFGASNVSKLLLHIPVSRRHEAVVTISYEAQARLSDPVYGCVSTILALQHQVASLQGELSMVQNQLINSRFAYANVLQSTQQHHHHHQQQQQQPNMNNNNNNVGLIIQPTYSNNSSASTACNLMNMSNSFNNNPSGFELAFENNNTLHSFDPPLHQFSRQDNNNDEDDEEQESRNINVLKFSTRHSNIIHPQ